MGGEFINGFNPNISNYNKDIKKGNEQNNNPQVENLKEEKGTDKAEQNVSQEEVLNYLNQRGNFSMAQINMVSSVSSKPSENISDLINSMLNSFTTEVVKGLTAPESIEKSMVSFEELVNKATLVLNTEFGGIAQFDNMSEEEKLALAAQFVLNMFFSKN